MYNLNFGDKELFKINKACFLVSLRQCLPIIKLMYVKIRHNIEYVCVYYLKSVLLVYKYV